VEGGFMLVARYRGKGIGIGLKEEAAPVLREGDVLIKVYAVGVCSTDAKIVLGKRNIREGLVLGHEIAGEIVEIKGKAEDYRTSDRVAIFPGVACKKCYYCLNNYENICTNKVSFGLQMDGGFQQYMRVPAEIVPKGNMLKLYSGVSYDEGSLLEPISCCIESIDLCRVKEEDNVLIVGAGVMGLLHLIMLKSMNCNVIVSELKEFRRKVALELGADLAVNPVATDLKDVVLDSTKGIGVDECFICVDVPLEVAHICEMVRRRGTINLFASSISEQKISLDPNILHYKEIILTGSHSSTLKQFYDSLDVLQKGKDKMRKLLTHFLPLEGINEALAIYLRQEGIKVIVKPNYN